MTHVLLVPDKCESEIHPKLPLKNFSRRIFAGKHIYVVILNMPLKNFSLGIFLRNLLLKNSKNKYIIKYIVKYLAKLLILYIQIAS